MDFNNTAVSAFSSEMKNLALRAALPLLPSTWRQRLTNACPPLGRVNFGALRRVTPISRVFGLDRGQSICRYYIDDFLSRNACDIGGRVLEIADNKYTRQFGGNRVSRSDVLHVQSGKPEVTIVADLTAGNSIASDIFDCIILTQTLQFIYDLRAAISTVHRILKPGGVVLATVSGISQISRYDMDRWGDYWRLTHLSARKLFEEAFAPSAVRIDCYGNVLAANAYLHGLAAEELTRDELDYHDPDYQLLITVRAKKLK
jgi:SAM-dependent methyltransferase